MGIQCFKYPRQRIPFSFSKALCIPICDGTPLDKDPFVLPQGFHWHFANELLLKFLILHATMHDRRPVIDTVDFYSNMSTRLQIDICPQTQGLKRATGHFPVKHDIVFGKIVRHRIDNELEKMGEAIRDLFAVNSLGQSIPAELLKSNTVLAARQSGYLLGDLAAEQLMARKAVNKTFAKWLKTIK